MGAWDHLDIPKNEGSDYWNPQEPEKIQGKVLEIDTYEDQEGNLHPQVVLDVDGEELTVTAFRSILKQELNDIDDLSVGDELEIDFQGKPKGKRYFVYRVKKLSAAPKRAKRSSDDEF